LEAKTNYTLVGLAVIVLAAALLIAALWLSVGFEQKKYHIYGVHIHEAVSGLSEDSVVKYNGVQVGKVSKIELSPINPQEVVILLSIVDDTPITTKTSATLISQGITGNTYVGLSSSSSDLTPLQKLPEEPYPIIPATPSLFHQLDSVLKDVAENIKTVSVDIRHILDKENALYLKKSLANMQKFTDILANNSETISGSLKSSRVLLDNAAVASEQLPAVIHNFNQLINEISRAGNHVSETMLAGRETFDKISEQTLPPAMTLFRHLNTIAANLEKVSMELRQNPAVVIRGIAAQKPGPGE
jgi:phospholipid/cholesterol/gamma-HCH transport system substrate-binding protein